MIFQSPFGFSYVPINLINTKIPTDDAQLMFPHIPVPGRRPTTSQTKTVSHFTSNRSHVIVTLVMQNHTEIGFLLYSTWSFFSVAFLRDRNIEVYSNNVEKSQFIFIAIKAYKSNGTKRVKIVFRKA